MLRNDLDYLQILGRHAISTHLTTHTGTLKHFSGIRTSTDRTGFTLAVILTVRRLSYTAETMALHYALETFTFRCTNYIHVGRIIEQFNRKGITQIQFLLKTCELGQVALGRYSSFLKMSHQRIRRILLLCVHETNLHSSVTIGFYILHLSNHTRTSFDNSAWYILTLGTENGSHSDFLS